MIPNNYRTLRDKVCVILICVCSVMILGAVFMLCTHLSGKPHYEINVIQQLQAVPETEYQLSRNEFERLHDTGVITYNSYGDYVQAIGASAQSTATMTTQTNVNVQGPNKVLYDIADEYFQVYYGTQRVSPVLPMAISNVETPGRADHTVTWCSLLPTKYISVDEALTFDVTQVLRDEAIFSALSTEYSTRDRGCLQMSPTYGTGDSSVNSRMSGTEKDKLSAINTSTHAAWVNGASSSAGDRFYLPDVLLRMQSAMQSQVSYILQNGYQPTSDLQLIAMLSMSHQSSGIWSNKDHSKTCGCWKSSELCYQWSALITSEPVLNILVNYAATHDDVYIDTSVAVSILKQVDITNMSAYASKSIVCTYPVKCLYAYIKLCQLYTGQ